MAAVAPEPSALHGGTVKADSGARAAPGHAAAGALAPAGGGGGFESRTGHEGSGGSTANGGHGPSLAVMVRRARAGGKAGGWELFVASAPPSRSRAHVLARARARWRAADGVECVLSVFPQQSVAGGGREGEKALYGDGEDGETTFERLGRVLRDRAFEIAHRMLREARPSARFIIILYAIEFLQVRRLCRRGPLWACARGGTRDTGGGSRPRGTVVATALSRAPRAALSPALALLLTTQTHFFMLVHCGAGLGARRCSRSRWRRRRSCRGGRCRS